MAKKSIVQPQKLSRRELRQIAERDQAVADVRRVVDAPAGETPPPATGR